MKRRKFINATLAVSALPLGCAANTATQKNSMEEEKELYELRTYELKFGGNSKLLLSYLKNALQPALKSVGVNHFMLFEELGNADPKKIWVLISYPNSSIYLKAQNLSGNEAFQKSAEAYNKLPATKPIFNRYTSSLLLAFDGMPQMLVPQSDAALFELRTYEGYNEDAVRRKIKMFNVEEFPLFNEVGLHPVFFGDVIAGPYRPALTYLLHFKNMAERDANWKKFIAHPDWNAMKVKEEYLNTLSNIRKVFLKPI